MNTAISLRKKVLWVITMVLWGVSSTPTLHAQEFIKQLGEGEAGLKYYDLRVREVDADTWMLAHSAIFHDSGIALIKLDSANADDLAFFATSFYHSFRLRITDFKINNDSVFFIGQYSPEEQNQSVYNVLGHFPLENFPKVTVTVFYVSQSYRFTQLETYTDYRGNTRLLTILHDDSHDNYIVAEFIPDGPNHYNMTSVHVHEAQPPYDIADDIIATNNYVIFSTRSRATHQLTMHFFHRSSSHVSSFMLYATSRILQLTPRKPTALAQGENNDFALTCVFDTFYLTPVTESTDPFRPPKHYFTTLFYEDTNLFCAVRTALNHNSDSIVDAQYNPHNNACDVVIFEDTTYSTRIYHVTKHPGLDPITRFHHYNSQLVENVDYLKHRPGWFATATVDPFNQSLYTINRYGHNHWDHCGILGRAAAAMVNINWNRNNYYFTVLTSDFHGEPFEHTNQVQPILDNCHD